MMKIYVSIVLLVRNVIPFSEFTEEYPNKPPTVKFVSKMFHPNVYADGGICLDILQNRCTPTLDVSANLTKLYK